MPFGSSWFVPSWLVWKLKTREGWWRHLQTIYTGTGHWIWGFIVQTSMWVLSYGQCQPSLFLCRETWFDNNCFPGLTPKVIWQRKAHNTHVLLSLWQTLPQATLSLTKWNFTPALLVRHSWYTRRRNRRSLKAVMSALLQRQASAWMQWITVVTWVPLPAEEHLSSVTLFSCLLQPHASDPTSSDMLTQNLIPHIKHAHCTCMFSQNTLRYVMEPLSALEEHLSNFPQKGYVINPVLCHPPPTECSCAWSPRVSWWHTGPQTLGSSSWPFFFFFFKALCIWFPFCVIKQPTKCAIQLEYQKKCTVITIKPLDKFPQMNAFIRFYLENAWWCEPTAVEKEQESVRSDKAWGFGIYIR